MCLEVPVHSEWAGQVGVVSGATNHKRRADRENGDVAHGEWRMAVSMGCRKKWTALVVTTELFSRSLNGAGNSTDARRCRWRHRRCAWRQGELASKAARRTQLGPPAVVCSPGPGIGLFKFKFEGIPESEGIQALPTSALSVLKSHFNPACIRDCKKLYGLSEG